MIPIKLARKITISVLFAGLVAGCGSDRESEEGFLRLRLKDDLSTLDPALIVDVPSGTVAAKIFNNLVRFDREGKIVPDLARRWEISPDGTVYRFYLRGGVKFHSGRELEAGDVIHSLRRLLDPAVNSPRFWLLEAVAGAEEFRTGKSSDLPGIRSPQPGVVEIELSRPVGLFLNFLALPNGAVIPRETGERPGDNIASQPVGTGPFRLREWRRQNRLVLVRNPDYFAGPPALPGVVYRVIPETLTAAVEFERGNLDLIEVPRAEYKKYTSDQAWKDLVESRVGLNIYYLGFNCRRPPFDDPRVRRAFNHALDREKIIEVILENRAVSAAGPVPPGLLPPAGNGYSYDPARARELLAEAGVELPLKATLLFKSDREVLTIAEVIQSYLKEAGIELILVQREWSSFLHALNQGDFDLFYLSWWGDYPDPENFLYPTFHSDNFGPGGNRSLFSDSEVDGMLGSAAAEADPGRRREILRAARDRVVELAPWVFLWHKKEVMIRSRSLENYRIPLIYNGDKFLDLRLAGTGE
jgi:ABC-type transport system substrate-binding protein